MNKKEIKKYLNKLNKTKDRNMVVVDFGNVQKWERSLKWKIGIKELGNLIKCFSQGNKFLRRFYYGSDFGPKEKSKNITLWSGMIFNKAKMNSYEIITKRVKYIPDRNYKTGFSKKCNFDIEIAVDLIREKDNYDTVVLFSGDGDFGFLIDYLNREFGKKVIVFGARGHIGKEIFDARINKTVKDILFIDDFEYRLNMNRFNY